MRIIAVDDEKTALKKLELLVRNYRPESWLRCETSPVCALAWLRENEVDAALLDIGMQQMDGLTLAKEIAKLYPQCAIIFITGHAEYAVQAFALKASGYLIKPVGLEELRRELDYVRNGMRRIFSPNHRLRVQCFGSFEVFANGKPVSFPRQKSKELFAYLIDRRGAQSTMAEIAAALWEDGQYNDSRNSQIHNFLHDLTKTLDALGEPNVILRGRNAVAVDVSRVSCDAYACLDGDPAAINSYTGEYMSQYSWAEFTTSVFTKQFF
jgi:two-component SAPR family response regulator